MLFVLSRFVFCRRVLLTVIMQYGVNLTAKHAIIIIIIMPEECDIEGAGIAQWLERRTRD